MSGLIYLIPISICLGAIGLGAFLWALKNGQYDDSEGDAARILFDDNDKPMFGQANKTRHQESSLSGPAVDPHLNRSSHL